jgi:hypothetical protein
MRNTPVYLHPLMGQTFIYRPHEPVYERTEAEKDVRNVASMGLGGTLVVAAGMRVGVKQVFRNWNDVPGLDMLYVHVFATGLNTHVTPFDLGLSPLAYAMAEPTADHPRGRLIYEGGEPFTWKEMNEADVEDYLSGHWTFDRPEYVREAVIDKRDVLLYPDYLARDVVP